MNNNQVQKITWRTFINKYLIRIILWFSLTASLITLVVIIRVKSDFSKLLLQWDFFNNSWNFSYPPRTDITLFETYLYMAILAAILALTGLIFVQVKITIQKYIAVKYQVTTDFDNNYFIFKNLLFVNIAKSITYIFCFTSALTFILVLVYWLVYFFVDILSDINFKVSKIKSQHIKKRWKDKTEKKSLTIVLAIEALYFLIKNLLKINAINIDFDQILKYFIPASSLALIIAVFIQTLIKNDVKQILKNINNIQTTADNFKIFYQLEGKNVLTNYNFVCDLPSIIKIKLKDKNISKAELLSLLDKIYYLTVTLENKNNTTMKTNEFNYLVYHVFFEIKTDQQLEKIINHFKMN